MLTFIGNHSAKVDAKGRVFIPSGYRKILFDNNQERFVMRKDTDKECLILYPENVWNEKVKVLKANLDEWNGDDQLLLMQFVSDAEWLDIDNQGRVLISKRHLGMMSIESNEVLFVGMMDRIAIWSKKRYEQIKIPMVDFAQRIKEKMELKH